MALQSHTPTPWMLVPPDEIVERSRIAYGSKSAPRYIKLTSPWREEAWNGDEEAEANAAFIVKAVNAHDELVAALKEAAAFVRFHYAPAIDAEQAMMARIDAALTKAQPE